MPVKIGLTDTEDSVAEKYPGLQEYTVCQSKAFVQGILGCVVGASAAYTGSILFRRRFPIASKHTAVVLSIVCGVTSGYIITSIATQKCQNMWVNLANDAQQVNSHKIKEHTKIQALRKALESDRPAEVHKNKYGDSFE
ncbi:transmembrane protein 141-like [Antedon mediterranea]|uniref:transmembrane protein 141-like n=1 Tax=Antedon mediterranea TaxID=105859 RepID=UPI003AF53030